MSDNYLEWRPHPWHGLQTGPNPPTVVTAFVEITPFDHIKYEVDKHSGFLKIDRPQYSSSRPPTLYGFIPRTLSGDNTFKLMEGASVGDDDPLDICVISSHPVSQSQIILSAQVVGGIPMMDGGEADDKIIGVLVGDAVWGDITDVSQLPAQVVDQLVHYFATYKFHPVTLGEVYGREHAEKVLNASMDDYHNRFGN
jgi:inorganic pyrophosphatase